MSQVYAIGETLLDIIFHPGGKVTATAGGSMLNTAVSLGRLGIPVHLVSEYADDRTGRWVDQFLKDNGVSLQYIRRYTGTTPLALAFLDEQKMAGYQFYPATADTISSPVNPPVVSGDILIFGSFYSLKAENRPGIMMLLQAAREKQAIIVYDPNFREPHLHELPQTMPVIMENIRFSQIIRGSDEDFRFIFGETDPEKIYHLVAGSGCSILIYTMGSRGVILKTASLTKYYKVPATTPVSTIGAGDSFNAGVISTLYRYDVAGPLLNELSETQWDEIIAAGIDFATSVCRSDENYISCGYTQLGSQ
jgi:fructokinase